MNVFFQRKHYYETHTAIEDIRSRLKELRKTSWHDIAVNLTGKVEEDNSFKLENKSGFVFRFGGIPQNTVLIEGNLIEDNTNTNIHITARCNYFLVFLFYLSAAITMYDLYTFLSSNFATDLIRAGILFFFLLFFIFFIRQSLNSITQRFERYLQVGKR